MSKINHSIIFFILFIVATTPVQAFEDERPKVYSEFAIVVHKTNHDQNIDFRTKFLLQDQSWSSGERINPYDIDNPFYLKIKKIFLKRFLSMSLENYQSYWKDRVAGGKTRRPTKLGSFERISNYTEKDREAIAYIPAEMVTNQRIVGKFKVRIKKRTKRSRKSRAKK